MSRQFALGFIAGIVALIVAVTVLTWPIVPAMIAMALYG